MKGKKTAADHRGTGSSDVYLLKIYHRGRSSEESLVGTVEHVTAKKKKSFRTERELLQCLDDMNA